MRGRLFSGLLSGSMLFSALAVQAITLTVTSESDSGGTCPGPDCTLRQAIATASPGDTIDFAHGITTINLTSAELLIDKDLTINGPGANLLTVRGNGPSAPPDFRVLHITTGNVTLSGLTISGGVVINGSGGGILNGTGTLTVADCTISGNNAGVLGGTGGGGIFNSNGGTVNVIRSTLSSNTGTCGGGTCGGGGVFNSPNGTVNIQDSTLSNNHSSSASSGAGGNGVFNSAGGTVNIANSTLSGNNDGFHGGGIYNRGVLTLTGCTISGNAARASGGGIRNDGTVNARNTIIANNSTESAGSQDFFGTLVSQGYNLIRFTDSTTITGDTTGNQLNVDPLIGPLQDNGGPTLTRALLPGSPAIDGGHSSGFDTDQRGLPRPVDDPGSPDAPGGDGSDIGAFEVQTFPTPTPTPQPTATPTPTPTPTPTATPTPTPTPARSLNISTRARVQTGDNVMIGGFILTGNTPRKVILRALGPSLQSFGLTGLLADPTLELRGPNGSLILTNNDWRENSDQALLIQASGIPPQNDLESAIVATLSPAGYTAIVRGNASGTGLGLVEVYDLDSSSNSKLANISTRAFVETGNNVVIGGFILGGTEGSPKIIIRAIGPSLAQLGIANPLADPTLELRDGNGQLIAFNDNWRDNPAQAALIIAAQVEPRNDLEAAIAATLLPGPYTAIVAGRNGGVGVGLIEVYNLQ